MKITDIRIDGFGIWSGLTLRDLSPEGVVIYGPNEAGKTTLLQFIRAVFYGFSPDRQSRYLPPLRAEAAGGAVGVVTPAEGRLQIHRSQDPSLSLGAVDVIAADGTVQGEPHVRRLLHNVDEATFNNVFAVGLREMQELGSLNDTDAAGWLYSLAAGLDRISLHDVLRDLNTSRLRIVGSAPEQPSIARDLVARKSQLESEINKLRNLGDQHHELTASLDACRGQIAQLDEKLAAVAGEVRIYETALLVFDLWQRRAQLDVQIDAAGVRDHWPANAVARMKRLLGRSKKRRQSLRRLALERADLKRQYREILVNPALSEQAARIEALADHQTWIATAEQEIDQLEAAAEQLRAELSAQGTPLSDWTISGQSRDHAWPVLRSAAAAVKRAARRYKRARRRLNAARRQVQGIRERLQAAGGSRHEGDLSRAITTAGERVAQLRRRVQLDERLQQLSDTKADLEEQVAGLVERQLLPVWMLLAVGAVFVLGFVLLLGGLFLPKSFTGSWGWPMAGIGAIGMVCAVAAKSSIDRTNASRLASNQRQLELVDTQITESQAERDVLDRTVPIAGLPDDRLQAAQHELAQLEQLLPLDAQLRTARETLAQARRKLKKYRRHRSIAHRRWAAALTAAGFPADLRPSQIRTTLAAAHEHSTQHQKLAVSQSVLERRRQELLAFANRIEQLLSTVGLVAESSRSSERLAQLKRELADNEAQKHRRLALVRQLRNLKRRSSLVAARLRRLKRRRQSLLAECHVADMDEFRRRAASIARFAALVEDRDSAAREISILLAGVADEARIAELLADRTADQIRLDLASNQQATDALRRQQQELLQDVGRLGEQLQHLRRDRRMAAIRLELAQVEERLNQALARWQTLTVTQNVLLSVKQDYELNRQPETLREASGYLAELTASQYRRVWTPLGENKLLVDSADGQSLPVEVLSRGTREQLFLSLRLALASLFARRGAPLPLILDDVLVNFDARRAAAAAAVLRQFAERGHQLLLLTCHEHTARMFKHHEFDVRRLPDNSRPGRDLPFDLDLPPVPRRTRLSRDQNESAPHSKTSNDLISTITVTATAPPSTIPTAATNGSHDQPQRRLDPPHRPPRTTRGRTNARKSDSELHAVRAVKSLDELTAPIIIEPSSPGDQ